MSLAASDYQKWAELAQALRLTPYQATEPYEEGYTFGRCKAALVSPTTVTSHTHPLWGVRNGVEFIVLSHTDLGTHHSHRYTSVIANVDPPLSIGLELRSHQFIDGSSISLGDPAIDSRLHLKANDPEQVRLFFSSQDPGARVLLEQTLLHIEELTVSDSTVSLRTPGFMADPRDVDARVAYLAWLAGALVARRAALPPTRTEHMTRASCGAFAEAHNFTFDPQRIRLLGTIAGSQVEIAFESYSKDARTMLTVRFPSTHPTSFVVRRTEVHGFFAGETIELDDPLVDNHYVVRGQPREDVIGTVGQPALMDVLGDLRDAEDVLLDQTHLDVRLQGPWSSPERLDALGRIAQVVATAFAPTNTRTAG